MRRSIHFIALALLIVSSTQAHIPRTLSYQGVLSDTAGAPKPDGTYGFTFRLYDVASGGSALWSETTSLPVQRGLFSAVLGSVTAIPASVTFDEQYWLGVQVGADPELSPRIQLTSVGSSFNALQADLAQTVPDNSLTVAKISETGATSGQVIAYNGTDVVWQNPGGVSGTGVATRMAFWNGTNTLTSDPNYTLTSGNSGQVALGFQCTATGNNGVAIGSQCSASGPNTVAIGAGSSASSNGACAVGVNATASGVRAHAIGNFVTASNGGSFVMGDANTTALTSSASNQLSMRFVGGYRLFSNSAFTTGVTMAAGVSGWTNVCDRNLKENFSPVDGERLLDRIRALPITEWNYKNADPHIRYIGPMAQDFYRAFHLGGTDSLGINSIIADGVNLAAIKALEERTNTQQKIIDAQHTLLIELRRTVAELQTELVALREQVPAVRPVDSEVASR